MYLFMVRVFLAAQLSFCVGTLVAAQNHATAPDADMPAHWQDQTTKSLAGLKKQLSEIETTKGEQHPDLIPLLYEILKSYGNQGAYVPALPFAQRALAITREIYGEGSVEVAVASYYVGWLNFLAGDNKAAIEDYKLSQSILVKNVGTEHPTYAMLLIEMGNAYLADGKIKDAESAMEKALQFLGEAFGSASGEVTVALEALGRLHLKKGDYTMCEQELVYALTIRSEGTFFDSARAQFDMAPLQNLLGALYTTVGLYDLAGPLLKDALKAYEAKLGKKHPLLEEVLVNLATHAEAGGDSKAAALYKERAESIHKENLGISHLATVPLVQPVKAVLPSKDKNGLFADSRVGDWVTYAGPDGTPLEKQEITRITPVVAVVLTTRWDPQKEEFDRGGIPMIVSLATTPQELFGVAMTELKTETLDIDGQQVNAVVMAVSAEGQDEQCKVWLAREIPVGGLAKMECDGKLIVIVLDFKRGK